MNGTDRKKAEGKFTIQFSRTDPAHLQVAGILNSKERRGKAQYIVNAILFYESHGGTLDTKHTTSLDEKTIEAITNRILHGIKDGATGILHDAAPSAQTCGQPQPDEDTASDDAIEALGMDGISAVIGAMEMFRMKK